MHLWSFYKKSLTEIAFINSYFYYIHCKNNTLKTAKKTSEPILRCLQGKRKSSSLLTDLLLSSKKQCFHNVAISFWNNSHVFNLLTVRNVKWELFLATQLHVQIEIQHGYLMRVFASFYELIVVYWCTENTSSSSRSVIVECSRFPSSSPLKPALLHGLLSVQSQRSRDVCRSCATCDERMVFMCVSGAASSSRTAAQLCPLRWETWLL